MRPLSTRTLIIVLVVFAAVFILLGALVNKMLYLGLIGLALVRPLLREFEALADRDERQTLASYRSSHIAFLVAMFIAGIIVIKTGAIDGGEPQQESLLILLVALFVKFAMLQLHSRSRAFSGRLIAYVIGGAWLIFTLASHGFSPAGLVEGAVWIVVLASAFSGRYWPKVGGSLLVIEGLITLWFFVIASPRGFSQQYFVLLLLPLPLILAGILLLVGDDRGGADREAPPAEVP